MQREAIARKREDALQRRVACATRKTPVRFEVAQSLPEGARVKLSVDAGALMGQVYKDGLLVDYFHIPQEVVGRVRGRWGGPTTPALVVGEACGCFTVEV